MAAEEQGAMEATVGNADLQVGMRIQHHGSRGVVRYVGNLRGRDDQTWVGVEWDDASRGKHSGSVDGVSYFTTKERGSGSFIKASKLGNGGRTDFLHAAEQRYVADASDTAYRSEHHAVGGTGGVVEFRVRNHLLPLTKLEFVDVSSMCVASLHKEAAELRRLGELFVAMRELRIAESLFSSITVMHDMLSAFSGLQVLDVSRNVLNTEERTAEDSDRELRYEVRVLVMNQCSVTWDGVQGVCARTPNLRELRVHDCEIMTLGLSTMFVETFAKLELLDLDCNSVPWGLIVSHLGALPCLHELYLSRNGLLDCDSLPAPKGEGLTLFPKLKTLSLAGNKLDGWQVVTALHRLRALRRLRLARNKITADYVTTGCEDVGRRHDGLTSRMQAIARIGSLEVLDGSEISADERKHAEKMYLTVVCGAAAKRDGLEAAEKEHPRLRELRELFGLDEIERSSLERTHIVGSARKGLVEVRMRAGKESMARRKSVTRLMPRCSRLGRVKRIAERLLRIEGPQVDRISVEVGNGVEVVEDESREIEFWLGSASGSEGLTVVCG